MECDVLERCCDGMWFDHDFRIMIIDQKFIIRLTKTSHYASYFLTILKISYSCHRTTALNNCEDGVGGGIGWQYDDYSMLQNHRFEVSRLAIGF